MKIKTIFPISLAAVLAACGPTTETPKELVSFNGKVIDGYVSGATVFLDLNYNHQLDDGEPNAISTQGGAYELALDETQQSCIGFAPVVVDVPVGAIDEDLGEVTEAYQMLLPPAFDSVSSEAALNVTPLTTALWQTLQQSNDKENASKTAIRLTCDQVKENPWLAVKYDQLLEDALAKLVAHYNLSAERLTADFIANDDSDASEKAQAIVATLQKSLQETIKLRSENPEADYVYVTYHQSDDRDGGEDQYTEAWYRESYIATPTSSTFQLDKVTDDLQSVVKTIIYGETVSKYSSELNLRESYEFESRDGDEDNYTCDSKEFVTTEADSIEYELVNLVSKDALTFEDCIVSDFTVDASGRYAFVNYQADNIEFATQYTYGTDSAYPYLTDWVNLIDQADYLDASVLVSTLSVLSYRFDDTETGTVDWWEKSKTYYSDGTKYWVRKDIDGNWKRTLTYSNGESVEQCGTDGLIWGSCE
jgi:hypothetical protein